MRNLIALLLLSISVLSQESAVLKLPAEDAIRIQEFYRLASSIQDHIWPGWGKVAAPLMLVAPDAEFLTHHPSPPKESTRVADDVYARPRQFPTSFQATFPAFGPPAVMVVGEPSNTISKTSTPWLIMLMHEHFHQLQWAQPNYVDGVNAMGLSHGDTSGMWMLNFPFPYEKPEVAQAFAQLRDSLLRAIEEPDTRKFERLAQAYIEQRKRFFALVSTDDHKYFSFQLWQEGIARYTEVKSAEAAAEYSPTAEFTALADYEPFTSYAASKRKDTLNELRRADLTTWKREVVYSFGATEGFLLDRMNPKWKKEYFQHMFSTDSYFSVSR